MRVAQGLREPSPRVPALPRASRGGASAPIAAGIVLGVLVLLAWPAWAQSGPSQAPTPAARSSASPAAAPPTTAPRQPVHPAPGTASRPTPPSPPATPAVQAPKPPTGGTKARPPARDAAAALPLPLPPPPPPPDPLADPAQSAATAPQGAKPPSEESRVPRFASLKSDTVNLRAGPGTRYPIQWVYNRRDLPVEIEREFEVWRAVRDPDGVRGWVHSATLTERRTFIVKGADATVRSDRKDTASAVAVARVNVMGRLRSCEAGSAWCEVRIGSVRGYLRRDQIWGLLPNEAVKP